MNKNQKQFHKIIWLTGQSGAGKSTLADILAPLIGAIILDNDEIRNSLAENVGFSEQERKEHNIRVAKFAKFMAQRTPVIVSVIAPFEETRREISKLINPVWVYIKRDLPKRENYPYEEPVAPDIVVEVTNNTDPNESAKKVARFLRNI